MGFIVDSKPAPCCPLTHDHLFTLAETEYSPVSSNTEEGRAPTQIGSQHANQRPRSPLGQRLLASAANLPQFVHDLLATQVLICAGSEAAGFVVETREEGGQTHLSPRLIAHVRPDTDPGADHSNSLTIFQEILSPCLTTATDGAIAIQNAKPGQAPQFCLVTLLYRDRVITAVTAVITRCPTPERAQQLLVAMQLVAGYFDFPATDQAADRALIVARGHQDALQLIAAVAATEGFEPAARGLCNELATRTGASRASIGWVRGQRIAVRAMSHTEQFDRKQELMVRIQRAMEECLDQEEPVRFDLNGTSDDRVSREAAALSRAAGNACVLSLPLRHQEKIVGVLTLEFATSGTVTDQTLPPLTVAVDLLAPQLNDRFSNDRWWLGTTWVAFRQTMSKLIGPTHTLTKVIICLILLAAWFISPWSSYVPMYRVSAPFRFVPQEKWQQAAPFDGYLAEYFVLPGDRVHKGEPLARMETKELELKQNEAASRILALQRKADAFGADPSKQAERQIALAEKLEAQAHLDLLSVQLEMAEITAPVDGEVLSGDLRDRVGSPFKVGEVLIEVADPSRLLVELAVQDRDIQEVRLKQLGWLATSSLPGNRYPFTIDRIVPLGEAREGTNIFKVYGRLDTSTAAGRTAAEQWRPGMTGEARIEIREASLFWQYSHRLADFIRLKTWL